MQDDSVDQRYATVVRKLLKERNVTQSEKKGFGSSALWTKSKIFALLSSRREFVVKLPRRRVEELISSGEGKAFDTGSGRLMKEWFVTNSKDEKAWLSLAKEAMEFASS
ncbi:MAG TPA: hypothetical protein VFE96_01525 [Candidatus Bathyarchaeia archaeon]|jgi:hypothetical protein|nr:hypothetical protein [Candidatus Bathyarchaeia archaeon]